MIPRSCKFPLRSEFLAFRRRAKQVSSPLFTTYYFSSVRSRCAVVVPKKVSKLATTRNWLKRLTYTSLWPLIKDKQLDLVIIYKPIQLTKSSNIKAQLVHELSQLVNSL